jgi:hypothetical protein
MNYRTLPLLLILALSLATEVLAAPADSVSAAEVAKAEAAAKKASQERAALEAKAQKIKTELGSVNQKMIAAAKRTN